jgi:hypothetical protein
MSILFNVCTYLALWATSIQPSALRMEASSFLYRQILFCIPRLSYLIGLIWGIRPQHSCSVIPWCPSFLCRYPTPWSWTTTNGHPCKWFLCNVPTHTYGSSLCIHIQAIIGLASIKSVKSIRLVLARTIQCRSSKFVAMNKALCYSQVHVYVNYGHKQDGKWYCKCLCIFSSRYQSSPHFRLPQKYAFIKGIGPKAILWEFSAVFCNFMWCKPQ